MSSVSALGSSEISSQLAQVEARLKAPITVLDNQITADKADISAWGAISGAVSSLSKSLAGISSTSKNNTLAATSSTTTVATATAASSAQPGTYSLTKVKLAKSQEIYSAIQSSGKATLSGGAGSLQVSLGNGKSETVQVGSGSLTLNGVAAAINKAAGGVQASVISTSTGARLQLQSSATGSSQSFKITGTGALAQFAYGSSNSKDTLTQSASDASVTLNGVPVTSASNTLGSAVPGLTISLAGSGSTTISVARSSTQLAGAMSSVATSLSAVLSTIATQTAFVPASSSASASASGKTPKSGPLLGNFTATDLSGQLLSAVSGVAASGLSAASIGLTVSAAGKVSFSSSTFNAALSKNPTGVQALVGKIYSTLNTISTGAIGTSGSSGSSANNSAKTGTIGAQTTSLNSAITSINAQIATITKENNAQLNILIAQYSAAEAESTSAQITQSYLNIFNGSGSSGG
jgi:flagellar hook-associated protein 2